MKTINFSSFKAVCTFALSMLVIFQSCKKNDVQNDAPTAVANNNITALRQSVAASVGAPADKVVYMENEKQFMINGDSYVSLQDAQTRFAADGAFRPGSVNGASQMMSYYTISSSKVNAIKIYADATVPATWLNALDSAIKNWNTSGSKVYMERIPTATGSTTKVTTNYSASSTIATAAYPDYYGRPGNKVTINTYQNGLSDSKKIFAITHELGHSLGFSHANETYGLLISGTPVTDASSVMNSVVLNWSKFTDYDLLAVKTIYPAPVVL